MTYILDLDHTLLDTNAFKRTLEESLAPLGISREQFQSTYVATVSAVAGRYDYTIAGHAKTLHEQCGIDEAAAIENLSGALDRLPHFLYPDSLPFLETLRDHGLSCILLTMGNAAFQEEKVRRLGIAPFFEQLVFTEEKKDRISLSLPDDPSKWIFVNDNPAEIRGLALRFPEAKMVRIKRVGAKTFPPEDDLPGIPTFPSLAEAWAYLDTET